MPQTAQKTESCRLEDYDFEYPASLVAERPAEPRDSSRLMALDRSSEGFKHLRFRELPALLRPGDCLVVNRSKVLPARLWGSKPTGGKVEVLVVQELEPGLWTALSPLRPGQTVLLPEGVKAEAQGSGEDLQRLRFSIPEVAAYLARHGETPLPPYIQKKRLDRRARPEDRSSYQTVYAKEEGSIAAPTAGLHFTPELLARLRAIGVEIAEITLHVGLGTFKPVTASDAREHRMLPERFFIGEDAARAISSAKARGGRVVAVGTTAVRTLETWARTQEREGETSLFIYPGHDFRIVDALITNFHLPRSTPLLLACAFAGKESILAAYREAVAQGYRLFSYGDAMLIA